VGPPPAAPRPNAKREPNRTPDTEHRTEPNRTEAREKGGVGKFNRWIVLDRWILPIKLNRTLIASVKKERGVGHRSIPMPIRSIDRSIDRRCRYRYRSNLIGKIHRSRDLKPQFHRLNMDRTIVDYWGDKEKRAKPIAGFFPHPRTGARTHPPTQLSNHPTIASDDTRRRSRLDATRTGSIRFNSSFSIRGTGV